MSHQTTSMIYSVSHSPTLNTVLMVEETLKKKGDVVTVAELKRRLPRQIMHSTLIQILNYLQESGKILITTKGIVWIYAPRAEIEAMKKRGIQL